MTDNEIKKALECCQQNTRCVECPMWKKGQNCMNKLYKYALDLINRQQAENDMWRKNCDDLYKEMSERLKAELKIERRLAKTEAYKEFVEEWHEALKEVREKFITEPKLVGKAIEVIISMTDELLEEKLGEQRKEDEGK